MSEFRRNLLKANAKPYNEEIEWLGTATSNNYIDLNYIPRIGDSITVNFMFTEHTYSSGHYVIFSAGSGTNKFKFEYVRDIGNGARGVFFRYFSDTDSIVNYTFTLNTWYQLIVDSNGNAVFSNKTTTSTPISELEGDNTLRLFEDKVSFYNNRCRIGSLHAERNGEKVLDLIPARLGTTGYMYDKVSRKLFGNSGTGNFIIPEGGGYKLILCHFPKKERRVAA